MLTHKVRVEVFLLIIFFGRIKEGSLSTLLWMLGRVHPWSHLTQGYSLLEGCWAPHQSRCPWSFLLLSVTKCCRCFHLTQFLDQTRKPSFSKLYFWRPQSWQKRYSLKPNWSFQMTQLVTHLETKYSMCSYIKLNSRLKEFYLSFSIII